MIQKLRRLLHLESYEEALRDFALVLEQSEFLKSEIDLMAREYSSSSKELDQWLSSEKELEVQELVKSQQSGLTSRYLSFLGSKKKEYDRLEESKKLFIKKYPHFEKALQDLKRNDFIEKTLDLYRENRLSLSECDTIIKAVTKKKVQYVDNIVFNQKGEILIVQRAPLDENGPNLWVLPGGHMKESEECEIAAKRELLEETGYICDDCWKVGEYDDDKCHIEYYLSMIDTDEQSPTVDANETRYTEFVPVKKLYDYPTMYNIWDNVYKILGIEESVVKIKKAIVEGFVKSSEVADKKVDEVVGGEDKKKKKFKKVMDEWKAGTLKSGGDGSKVTDQKQAIAIALGESGQSKEKAVEDEFEKAVKGKHFTRKYLNNRGKWVYVYEEKDSYHRWVEDTTRHSELDRNIRDKKRELAEVFRDMEADPEIKPEGGPLTDEYGGKLNQIEDDIAQLKKEQDVLTYGTVEQESDDPVPAPLLRLHFQKQQRVGPDTYEYVKEQSRIRHLMRDKSVKDTLHGGKADNKTLEDIAKHHKVDIEDLKKEHEKGLKIEKEHTNNEEKACEIVRDHLMEMPNYYSKLKTIEKSDITEFEKAKALGHLVPKKVQIKSKDGKIHMAIRWVNPQTGESEKYAEGLKEGKRVEGGTFEDRVAYIASSDSPKSDKVRNLIDLGIYDTSLLTLLTGEPTPGYFLKKSDIDLKELPDQSETILKEVRKEQLDNDTPAERESNKMLFRKPEDIEELWDNYERNLKRVIQGRHKFAIVYGTGGVGKSFTFEQLAKKFELREFDDEIQPSKEQYDYVVIKGRISPVQVYAEMYRHRDKLIVFDDCDSFLSTDEVQGFLKAGLDTGETTKISNKSSKKVYQVEGDPESGTIPNTFSFKGRVIAITNLVSKQIDQAVKSRALTSNLTMTVDETILKLSTIKNKIKILSADKSSIIEVSPESRDYAFSLIKEQKDKLGSDINTRTYANAVLMAHDSIEENVSEEKMRREIIAYFDSITGSFDEMIRKQKGK